MLRKGQKKTPSASNGTRDSTADTTLLNLAQSEWDNCLKRPANQAVSGPKDVYVLRRSKFSDATAANGELVYEVQIAEVTFASDPKCKSKTTSAKASQIIGKDLELDSETIKGKIEFGNPTGTSEEYEIDTDIVGKKTYALAKISETNFKSTQPCNASHVKEKLCSKIDGDRPDNRAKTWDMHKENDPGLTRVK